MRNGAMAFLALAGITLELLPLPVWVFAGSVGLAFVVTVWLMIRLLRRRFALLNFARQKQA